MVFTSDVTEPQLAVIDTATNKLKTWIPMPGLGYGSAPTADGKWLLVALPLVHQLAVIDLTAARKLHARSICQCSRKRFRFLRTREWPMFPATRAGKWLLSAFRIGK